MPPHDPLVLYDEARAAYADEVSSRPHDKSPVPPEDDDYIQEAADDDDGADDDDDDYEDE